MSEFVLKRISDRESKIRLIEEQIKKLDTEKAKLEKDKSVLDIELRAYKDVRDYANLRGNEEETEVVSEAHDDKGRVIGIVTAPRHRLSEFWKKILIDIGKKFPNELNTDEIRAIASVHNPEINDDTLRSQLSVYTARGFLERPKTGFYRLTEQGAAASGYHFHEDQDIFR